jgi:hypothetical protein
VWEVDEARQKESPVMKDAPGAALVFVAPLVSGKAVTGVSFVVKPQGDAHAPAVMESLRTLRGSP